MAVPSSTAAPLDRAEEVARLAGAAGRAAAGSGSLAVVEGPAGIGKTVLLAEAADAAEAAGLWVLRARGRDLERSFAFGCALQLFEPALAALDPGGREHALRGAAALARPLLAPDGAALPERGSEFSVVHGLYWLATNLAERRPLALTVDDAHWADEPSLRLLAYLAERVDELPVLLVVARRSDEPDGDGQLLDALSAHRLAERHRLAPLGDEAVARLAAAQLGAEPAPAFVASLRRLTGGNPFLLSELLRTAAAAGMAPSAADAQALADLAPEGVLRTVTARLGTLPADAAALARAVAVLGDDARLRHAAALAGLGLEAAVAAADHLAAAHVLAPGEPLAFCHALTAAAVRADLPAAAHAAAHLRAAELLRDEGAPPERQASHLLQAPATGQAWVVDALRATARRAMALGAPQTAADLLRRALDEPPGEAQRRAVLLELGRAEATGGLSTASDRLRAAAELTPAGGERARILRELARVRLSVGDHRGAERAYVDALAALNGGDPELKAHLRAEQLVLAAIGGDSRDGARELATILRDERVGGTPAGRALLATLAGHELYAGAPRDRVLPLVDRALATGSLLDDEGTASTVLFSVTLVLFLCEQLERNDALLSELVDRARRQGSVMGLAGASYSRAWNRLIAGRVTEALEDAQQAVDAGAHGWRAFLPGAYGCLAHALLDAGDVEAAERQVAEAEAVGDPEGVMTIQQLDARGRVHAVRGRHAEAAAAFLAAGEQAHGQRNPLLYATWRSNAALALARTGQVERARDLARTELALARDFGAPRGIAVALRALGVIEQGRDGLAHLQEAADVLEGSEAVLERARSLTELGAALRRTGRRADAGRVLGDALELARAGGMGAVERRAAEELEIAGAQATRAARRGREALSPSERRVAQLAAEGRSNREIAEELFVTRKAVEWHLSNAYAKLRISSRRELAAALKRPG